MALPVPDTLHLTLARFWRLVCDPAPGRLGYSLRMTCACTLVILICEIWQVPETALPAFVTMALWQKDRMTNVLAGVGVNLLFAVVILLMFGLVHLTLDHPLSLVAATALLSLGFFFLGSASKLKPVAYMLALIVVYALIAIDQAPVGELATRALLYADLFILIPGGVMVVVGGLICPSPKTVLTHAIAARLRLSARLLQQPDALVQEQATAMLREGAGDMLKSLKMAKLEKLWRDHDLECLHQAIYSSVATLALAHAATRDHSIPHSASSLIQTLFEMAAIFEKGDYPTDISTPSALGTSPALQELALLLSTFTTPAPKNQQKEAEKDESGPAGFFFPDAFTNPEHVRFAVKGTAAVMLSYFLFKVLAWPGIHTCVITCFIVALPTMGEMISKLTLRIAGALVGGAMGIGSLIILMPHLQNSAAFLAMMAAGALVACWIKTGDERIAYAGLQIGLAFFLSDLKGYGPTTDMTTARDRIIGILLGNFITYAVFTSIWPTSAYDKIRDTLRNVFHALDALAIAPPRTQQLVHAAAVQTALGMTERTIEFASMEPPHMRADMPHLAAYHTATQQAALLAEDVLIPALSSETAHQITQLEQGLPK
ncbi:fusaric acid resistance protein [Acetobacter tropicalis]|uniref:Fusaric acid resistance protein n=1 Tax=Acetobacter tropicalis TaxID=104102 RepID=A0A149TT42_9PROT|nr:FUSC family protein [Acetobacter tropicalis]KXV56374.1 fusaric acid resistance protein [Acetobacter tropicalis]